MTNLTPPWGVPEPSNAGISRRSAIKLAAAMAGGSVAGASLGAEERKPDERRGSPRRFKMKKSINLWAFPYPQRMNLRECLQLAKDAGFDGIELNYNLEDDLSPRHGTKHFTGIRK
ncbi:MAG: sugar phosphate isomerase/epimerase, partial [Planctomycetota bacterium]